MAEKRGNPFEPVATKVQQWNDVYDLKDHVFFIMDKSTPQQKLVGVFSTFEKAENFREHYMDVTKTGHIPQAIQIYPIIVDYWLENDRDLLRELKRSERLANKERDASFPNTDNVHKQHEDKGTQMEVEPTHS